MVINGKQEIVRMCGNKLFRGDVTAFHSLRFIVVTVIKSKFLITVTTQTYNLSIINAIALLLRATTKTNASEYFII